MNYLKITNQGEVDPGAFTLLGASTKRDNKEMIGMFGSGNKFAIAYFLRENINFRIFSGLREIYINKKTKSFRNNDFDIIVVNGVETSITTGSGIQWELWQAIREIYANALDEGNATIETVNSIENKDGMTSIYIDLNDDVADFYYNIDNYFALNRNILYSSDNGTIYEKINNKASIFRKSINCMNTAFNSIYDYNFNDLEINESRIVKYNWKVSENIIKLLYECDDIDVIKNIIKNISSEEYLESSIFNTPYLSSDKFPINQAWKDAIPTTYIAPNILTTFLSEKEKENTTFLSKRIVDDLVNAFGDNYLTPALRNDFEGIHFKKYEMTELQIFQLRKVLDFFIECDFDYKYPIEVVKFSDPNVLGLAKDNTIYISNLTFELGKDEIANTIIEEYIHLEYNVKDETREFQQKSIQLFINYMKTKNVIDF